MPCSISFLFFQRIMTLSKYILKVPHVTGNADFCLFCWALLEPKMEPQGFKKTLFQLFLFVCLVCVCVFSPVTLIFVLFTKKRGNGDFSW